MRQQMVLGEFIFGLASGFPYERLERKTEGGWVDLDVIYSKPLSHQTGQALEQLRLAGTAQLDAGMRAVDRLRAMANARQPYTLIDGAGKVWGRWRIDSVKEQQTRVLDDGTAIWLEWTLELKEFVNETR